MNALRVGGREKQRQRHTERQRQRDRDRRRKRETETDRQTDRAEQSRAEQASLYTVDGISARGISYRR